MFWPERAALACAILCVITFAVLSGRPSFTNASTPVAGMRNPALAIERARSVGDIDAILGDEPSPDREIMRLKKRTEFTLFAAHLAVFVLIALVTASRAAWGAAVLAFAAAVGGGLENVAILNLVDTSLRNTTVQAITTVSRMSSLKWLIAGSAMLPIAWVYSRTRRWPPRLAAGLSAMAGLLALGAPWSNVALSYAALANVLAVAANAVTLKFFRHEPPSRDPIPRSV